MSEKTGREVFFDKVQEIISTPIDDLIQNSKKHDNGILIYKEVKPKIKELREYLSKLSIENLNSLPASRFSQLNVKLKPIFDQLDLIQTTDKVPNQTDAQQKQKTVQFFNNPSNQSNGYFEREKENIWNVITEAITLHLNNTHEGSLAAKKVKELENAIDKAKESEEKINDILSTARTELSKGGVSKHHHIFDDQAVIHKGMADKWRVGIIWLFIVNVIFIISILSIVIWAIDDKTTRIEVGIFGAVLVSVISYAIVLCVKNFFAEKHNQNVSQHRANCLGTYNTFVDSADEERKAAILTYATNTIFSHQISGFLSKESEVTSSSPILEIIKKVADSDK